jgi:hypothetical protein
MGWLVPRFSTGVLALEPHPRNPGFWGLQLSNDAICFLETHRQTVTQSSLCFMFPGPSDEPRAAELAAAITRIGDRQPPPTSCDAKAAQYLLRPSVRAMPTMPAVPGFTVEFVDGGFHAPFCTLQLARNLSEAGTARIRGAQATLNPPNPGLA